LSTRFEGTGYPGANQYPFNFSVEFNPDVAGRILAAGIGADAVVEVTTGVYTHTFGFDEVLPYCTVQLYAAGVADDTAADEAIQLLNCKLDTISFQGGLDDILVMNVAGIGASYSAIAKPSFTPSTSNPLFLNNALATGKISIGATLGAVAQFDEMTDLTVDIANGLAPDHRINDDPDAIGMREGTSTLSGSFTGVYNHETWVEIDEFYKGNTRAIKIEATEVAEFVAGYNRFLEIDLNDVKWEGADPSWDPDLITASLPWKANVDATTVVIIQTADATVYDSAT